MAKIIHLPAPSVHNLHYQYTALVHEASRNFIDKGLSKKLTNGILKFVAYTYEQLAAQGDENKSREFIEKIENIVHGITKIQDSHEMKRISAIIRTWIEGIERVYKENSEKVTIENDNLDLKESNSQLYLKGQEQFFNALHSYLASTYLTQIQKTQTYIIDTFHAENQHHIAA